jgi:hypothetical protein
MIFVDLLKNPPLLKAYFKLLFQNHPARLFVGIIVSICLLYVWSSSWFVTTDGPSHAYNSMVLGQFLFHGDTNPFEKYLHIFWFPFPNWSGHLMLSLLLEVFALNIAEKILFSIYVVVFITGFSVLSTHLRLNLWITVSLITLFIFPKTFATGFFNYQLGFALLPWAIVAFDPINSHINFICWSRLFLISMALYFTHPIPYFMFLMFCGIFMLLENQRWRKTGLSAAALKLSALIPSFLLMGLFLAETVKETVPSSDEAELLASNFMQLASLVNYNDVRELPATIFISAFLGILLLTGLYKILKPKISNTQLTAFLCFAVMVLVYFLQPASFSSAGILSFRIEFIPHIFLIVFIGSFRWNRIQTISIAFVAVTLNLLLLNIRLPHKRTASIAVEEMMTAAEHMKQNESAIGLSCFHNGYYDKKNIARSNWIFTHVADYLNTSTKQLSFVNYESGQFHFPVKWNIAFYAYIEIACNQGLEYIPPCIDLRNVEQKFDTQIDNVFLVFAQTKNLEDHENYKTTIFNLQDKFDHQFTSETGVVELYKRKPSAD